MSVGQSAPGGSTYVLGHDDVELQRLLLQARLYEDDTEHALRRAGLRAGMRVLDVGCDPGDVSFLAARLVGPTGTVLGVDAATESIELARARAVDRGLSWVSFQQTAISDIVLGRASRCRDRAADLDAPGRPGVGAAPACGAGAPGRFDRVL